MPWVLLNFTAQNGSQLPWGGPSSWLTQPQCGCFLSYISWPSCILRGVSRSQNSHQAKTFPAKKFELHLFFAFEILANHRYIFGDQNEFICNWAKSLPPIVFGRKIQNCDSQDIGQEGISSLPGPIEQGQLEFQKHKSFTSNSSTRKIFPPSADDQ